MMMKADKIVSLRRGKSYTTSSRQTPPGSEGSKGKMVERCDIRGLPFLVGEFVSWRAGELKSW